MVGSECGDPQIHRARRSLNRSFVNDKTIESLCTNKPYNGEQSAENTTRVEYSKTAIARRFRQHFLVSVGARVLRDAVWRTIAPGATERG